VSSCLMQFRITIPTLSGGPGCGRPGTRADDEACELGVGRETKVDAPIWKKEVFMLNAVMGLLSVMKC